MSLMSAFVKSENSLKFQLGKARGIPLALWAVHCISRKFSKKQTVRGYSEIIPRTLSSILFQSRQPNSCPQNQSMFVGIAEIPHELG